MDVRNFLLSAHRLYWMQCDNQVNWGQHTIAWEAKRPRFVLIAKATSLNPSAGELGTVPAIPSRVYTPGFCTSSFTLQPYLFHPSAIQPSVFSRLWKCLCVSMVVCRFIFLCTPSHPVQCVKAPASTSLGGHVCPPVGHICPSRPVHHSP